jgi:hypothetical protein
MYIVFTYPDEPLQPDVSLCRSPASGGSDPQHQESLPGGGRQHRGAELSFVAHSLAPSAGHL